jgi:hypothetical protein
VRKLSIASIVFSLIVAVQAFAQSTNATVSGTLADSTGAVLPGVSITATNNGTGVVTSVFSNEAGVYNFASLLPGVYTVRAELPGFQTQTYTDVQLGNAAQVRLNFALQVATQAQSVEVTITADTLLATSSSSVGSVLPETQVRDLPLISNNVLELTQVMAGVFTTVSPVFGANDTKFAGVSARDVNVQRDGVSVNGARWPTGLDAGTEMHPDLVGEIKMILAPVDAEMGRGSGQVQIRSRSGTNQFHGGGVWSAQELGVGCEHLGEQSHRESFYRSIRAAALEEFSAGDGESGRPHREEQDALFCAVRPEVGPHQNGNQSDWAHTVRSARHLPLLRQLE